MRRSVDVLRVAEVGQWAELTARGVGGHLGEELSALERVATPSFEREAVPALAAQGVFVLLRWARRPSAVLGGPSSGFTASIPRLPPRVLKVLDAARRHAHEGRVLGSHAWDPEEDAPAVRHLHGLGLLHDVAGEPPITGWYTLPPDLPPWIAELPQVGEAIMDAPDDLQPQEASTLLLLHDMASLAAALRVTRVTRTVTGTIARSDAKKLGIRLGEVLNSVEDHPRWGMALRGLDALGVISTDPVRRTLDLDLGLERTLVGEVPEAMDRVVRRLIGHDLHPFLPFVRQALAEAGAGAVDEVVFLDLLREHHREILFPAWRRDGRRWYPILASEPPRLMDDAGWDEVETTMFSALLRRLSRIGLVRLAPGVFAPTEDGRAWAGAPIGPHPPVWVASDLEIMVPPGALTPWERFQIERLARCLARDVVDRYRLERSGVETWLSSHDIEEAIDLLRRRAPAVPGTVEETLRSWATSASRLVLTRGVLLEPASG
jgi:hypothetical protein